MNVGVEVCMLVGFRDGARAMLSQRLSLAGNSVLVAETIDCAARSAATGLILWNIPDAFDKQGVEQALTSLDFCVLCVAPRSVGAGFCLRVGAADAITRPWEVDEIVARAERLLAREGAQETLVLGNTKISLSTGEVLGGYAAGAGGEPSERCLRAAELSVLRYLARTPESYVPIQELQSRALGATGDGAAVRFHVKELRRKLGQGVIQTRRGFGYRLTRN